uniref:BTB domain-containing protein n=1 Tax=Heliothis virescens TaxID=7102 RepID=A0A2A4JEG6_HELVI
MSSVRYVYAGGAAALAEDSSEEEGSVEQALSLRDAGAPARVLHALNALRKSRQHYDTLLLAEGAELPAHRAVLAAASPYLLHALAALPRARRAACRTWTRARWRRCWSTRTRGGCACVRRRRRRRCPRGVAPARGARARTPGGRAAAPPGAARLPRAACAARLAADPPRHARRIYCREF